MNEIKVGSLLSYINIFLINFILILFTPFMIKTMGKSEYGLYALIGSFVGYLTVMDFGIGNTIIRYVAIYRTKNDKRSESNFLAHTVMIYSLLSVLVIIIGVICYNNISVFFGKSLTMEEIYKAKIMFIILVANFALTLPLSMFSSVVSAYEKFIFFKSITMLRILLRTVAVVVFLIFGFKAITVVVIDSIFNLMVLLITMIYFFKVLKIKIKFYEFDKPMLREMFVFSFFVFLNLVVDQIYWRIGQVILGMYQGTEAVAVFAIACSLSIIIYNSQPQFQGYFYHA